MSMYVHDYMYVWAFQYINKTIWGHFSTQNSKAQRQYMCKDKQGHKAALI
jgi:hypothetical protein